MPPGVVFLALIELGLAPPGTNLIDLGAHPAQVPPGTSMGGKAHLGEEVLVVQWTTAAIAVSRVTRVLDGVLWLNQVLPSHLLSPFVFNLRARP
jgi:hypothetical protein